MQNFAESLLGPSEKGFMVFIFPLTHAEPRLYVGPCARASVSENRIVWLLAEFELSQRVNKTLYSCDPVHRCALRYLCLLLRCELCVGPSLHWLLCLLLLPPPPIVKWRPHVVRMFVCGGTNTAVFKYGNGETTTLSRCKRQPKNGC